MIPGREEAHQRHRAMLGPPRAPRPSLASQQDCRGRKDGPPAPRLSSPWFSCSPSSPRAPLPLLPGPRSPPGCAPARPGEKDRVALWSSPPPSPGSAGTPQQFTFPAWGSPGPGAGGQPVPLWPVCHAGGDCVLAQTLAHNRCSKDVRMKGGKCHRAVWHRLLDLTPEEGLKGGQGHRRRLTRDRKRSVMS